MLLPLNILLVTTFKVTLVLQTLGTGRGCYHLFHRIRNRSGSCESPRTAVDILQTGTVGAMTLYLDYLGCIYFYLITNIIHKH